VADILGLHAEWNLGSPGGWDYQRVSQEIVQVIWHKLNALAPTGVDLDFGHPMLYPMDGFIRMLLKTHHRLNGANPGIIAVVAEEETLDHVTENINLARRLDNLDGITGILTAPHHLERRNGHTCYRGQPVSLIFMDFNNDVLLKLHRRHDLTPLLKAAAEQRVVNPRGTAPYNAKHMFEMITGPQGSRFQEITRRTTPWTRRFHPRATTGPRGESIPDLIAWTRTHWRRLVLKPERGHSGQGIRVGGVDPDGDRAIAQALNLGGYIVQEKVPLGLWAEMMPEPQADQRIALQQRQTDFRCLIGPDTIFGFVGRYGDVPTSLSKGGGIQPVAILRNGNDVRSAVERINRAFASLPADEMAEFIALKEDLVRKNHLTYVTGPVNIALRPRIIAQPQLTTLTVYCNAVWQDCLQLEKMWLAGALDPWIDAEEEELDIARSQPWQGRAAMFATDGLFSFGAHIQQP